MSMSRPNKTGPEWNIFLLVNYIGVTIQWNVWDVMRCDARLYSIKFFWRDVQARAWWDFLWTEPGRGFHSSLEYSHGRKGIQKLGWKLQGPLVRFVKENVT